MSEFISELDPEQLEEAAGGKAGNASALSPWVRLAIRDEVKLCKQDGKNISETIELCCAKFGNSSTPAEKIRSYVNTIWSGC